MEPFRPRVIFFRRLIVVICLISIPCLLSLNSRRTHAGDSGNLLENEVSVSEIEPDQRGGKAYRLTYRVPVPIDVYWQFKTDFDNDFLVSNKFIREHHFISRTGDTAVTENKYIHGPDVFFRWQTTIFQDTYNLEFVLLNPEACGQKFHYGSIQLEPVPEGTKVTQTAYFDFWGASFWAAYPWGGGMTDFLTYTAHWEQDVVMRLKNR
ncbi:hypothetical protein B2D07_03380 [Desulfococcus multivorans]|uniref:SRPBCC family protein n=1 Tax=Desulfococcus multivorans DSM 2059 TaxID=1121405 RepID=S7TQ51_DESML|nr:uncharacterized protein Dmul_07030 [Desulfococcus multivorans]AQU99911.1 hypothetical protein B2D07_03380 [Desulfococcus multivorans]EPR39342.1 hypothetical protein dsmv_2684 [Desulfococcus multivorans DSM 2059]SKA13024.1 hypothetical protein SAMN02745446_02905 [Desulfococcus multivorans DSM 2059]